MVIYGHPGRTSECQTGPTLIQDKPEFGNFEDLTGFKQFKQFLDT